MIAEFDGSWLEETNYIACEGRIAVPVPNHVAKPYFVVLRTKDSEVPSRVASGSWVSNIEFLIGQGTFAFDQVADRLSQSSTVVKNLLGTLLTQIAVIAREVRRQGTPYLT